MAIIMDPKVSYPYIMLMARDYEVPYLEITLPLTLFVR